MIRILVWFLLSTMPLLAAPRSESLDLLVVSGEQAAFWECKVALDGQACAQHWQANWAALFKYLDRNANGRLERDEALRMPTPFAVRQLLWGNFAPTPIAADAFAQVDRNNDGTVSPEELTAFYERAGLGNVIVGAGRPTATARLTKAISKHLDTNNDQKIDRTEWQAAPTILGKLDKNDDELLDPSELVEHSVYPGATGGTLLTAPTKNPAPHPLLDTFPLLVLPSDPADTAWTDAVRLRHKDARPLTRPTKPQATWQMAFSTKDDAVTLSGTDWDESSNLVRQRTATMQMLLRVDQGKWKDLNSDAHKRLLLHFADCDADSNGKLDTAEFALAKASQFKQMLVVADTDNDTQLSKPELETWLTLQKQIAQAHVLVTAIDHGPGLFEYLDSDYDGAISMRELRHMVTRTKDQPLDLTKLPQQVRLVVSRGPPQSPLGKVQRTGPEWFKAMDRNGDGDVSRKEFSGKPEVFDKLDLDKDGFLDVAEAKKASAGK